MSGSTPLLPNTPSWRGAQLKKSTWTTLLLPFTPSRICSMVKVKVKSLCFTKHHAMKTYEGVIKSFRTGRLGRELQMVQLSATRCSCIAIL
jgi:hypothetical protein